MITKLRALFLPDDSVVAYLTVTGSPFYNIPERVPATSLFPRALELSRPFIGSEFQITHKGQLRNLSLFHSKRI